VKASHANLVGPMQGDPSECVRGCGRRGGGGRRGSAPMPSSAVPKRNAGAPIFSKRAFASSKTAPRTLSESATPRPPLGQTILPSPGKRSGAPIRSTVQPNAIFAGARTDSPTRRWIFLGSKSSSLVRNVRSCAPATDFSRGFSFQSTEITRQSTEITRQSTEIARRSTETDARTLGSIRCRSEI
jgi:hypothetical protein